MQISITQTVSRVVSPLAWLGITVMVLCTSCSQSGDEIIGSPQHLTRESVSVVDGMILLDHLGPNNTVDRI